MRVHTFTATGAVWKVNLWDEMSERRFAEIAVKIEDYCEEFEALYSRFRATSLITRLTRQRGVVEVPRAFTDMLSWYYALYLPSQRKVTPCIGVALSDAGYDTHTSLQPQVLRRPVPDLLEAVRIVDPTHVELLQEVMLDFGALGKGYLVDRCADLLREAGVSRFLVNGSGDLYYYDVLNQPITVGLEHPHDASMVIGTTQLVRGSVCGSSTVRRAWGTHNHYIDPHTLTSPSETVAVWTHASSAVAADALASCLFFVPPAALTHMPFEYCIVNKDMEISRSNGFSFE
jgi:FAD:protein FMN transferase